MREDVSKVKKGYSWSINVFSTRNEKRSLGTVVVSDGEDGVKAS
jgi:hypothetical protein